MAIPITIPRLGWNMEAGVFLGWLKADGATVRAGEPLFTLESEKATEDVECFDSGVLRIPPNGPKAGETLAVGAVIGHLIQDGEPTKRPETQTKAISPRAKRVAVELGVDWQALQGSGRTGRIRERDVRTATPSVAATAQPSVGTIRRTIAERMLTSQRSTAPVTLTTTADATNLVNLRNQFKVVAEIVPTYTDFLAKLTAIALQKHPLLNARLDGDRIVTSTTINIGIAVDTDAGLLVPVLREVPTLSLKQLSAQARELAERARERKLKADELQGGTFTITNLGALGIDAFTPIINLPECAILGVGRIRRVPVALGEQIVVREQMSLSLTFDHRIVDGAPAARFLQMLSGLIENPGPALMT